MSNVMFYSHSKDDLKRVVKMVFDEIKKTEMTEINLNLEDDRLTQKQAASFMGTLVTSIIAWKKKGTIPYYQVGRSIFYSKNELLKIARKNQKTLNV